MADAVQMIKQDHELVKSLFKQFEKAGTPKQKKDIVEQTLINLETHSKLEEELFYPFVRQHGGESELMDEAEEEHYAAGLLVMELAQLEPSVPHYDAKYKVLSESVEMHIEEEESNVLPLAQRADKGALQALGQRMAEQRPKVEKEAKDMVHGRVMATAKEAFQELRAAMGR